MLIEIFNQEHDGTRYHIGSVESKRDISNQEITDLYLDWLGLFDDNEGPDSDSEFVDWLIATRGEFTAPAESASYALILL
ncbi:MAG: hypothetical protein ACYSWU_22225 [Planctomycetota bacterium]|jgi:hypothetical protein